MELLTVEAGGQTPRVVDRRGSVQAETIRVTLDGPEIDATGSVESVLTTAEGEGDDANDQPSSRDAVKRPRLLDASEPVLVTADRLFYDDTDGGCHLHGQRPSVAGRHRVPRRADRPRRGHGKYQYQRRRPHPNDSQPAQ